jgi:hypothetical protein
MSANIRAEIERRSALNAPCPHEVRNTGEKRQGSRHSWERECGARRSYGRGWCRSTALGPRGRCWVHSGWGTGPTTPEGKARSLAALARINAERAARMPEAVIARLAAEGRSLIEIAAHVPDWNVQQIRNFLIEEERRNG